MKKLSVLILTFVLFLSLCGCSLKQTVSRSGAEYIVSAIGFDRISEGLLITLETVITKTENTQTQSQTKLLTGTGKNIHTAFSQALKFATEPLNLSHLGVAIIGSSLKKEDFENICDWFYNKQDTTLSTFFIAAKNAEELLNQKPLSSIAVGYDLVGLLEQQSNESGADYQNQFYKIEGLRQQKAPTITLPFFTYSDKEFYFDGITVYKNNQPITKLTPNESVYYLFASDKQSAGTVIINDKPIKLTFAKTKYSLKTKDNPTICIDITLKSQRGKIENEEIRSGILSLFQKFRDTNTDIFNLSEIIKMKNPKLFENHFQQSGNTFYALNIEVNIND